MLLNKKSAVITGTNRGIGRAITEAFAREGANIWAHTRKETPEFVQDMQNMEKKYNVKITPMYFDMTDSVAMKVAVKTIMASKTPIDILVNNAGIVEYGAFQMFPMAKIRQVYEVNFFSVIEFTQLITRIMARQKKGSIINLGSVAGIDVSSGNTAYGTSKAAIIALTKTLSVELAPLNIRVNALAPGLVETNMLDTIEASTYEKMLTTTALNRLGQPEEIASAVVFFASELSSYITGQILRVDGGVK